MTRKSKNQNAGFTLLEVMVSVAILSLSLIVLFGFQGNTLVASGRAERMTIATMLARQKMVELELDLEKGMQAGEFPDERSEEEEFETPFNDFRWKMEIKKVELPAPVTADEGSVQALVARQLTTEIAKSVRELRFTVLWDELGEEQSIQVVTHLVKL